MTPEQLNNFKQAIITAIDRHIAGGGAIKSGSFGSGNCLCPISCLLGEEGRDMPDKSSKALVNFLSEKMGFPLLDEEIWGLILGFDSKPKNEMYAFGRELRTKYNVKDY